MTNKILITGHEGYLGSVMTLAFLNAGFDVTGLDTGYFRNCLIVPQLAEVPSLDQDIRDLKTKDLEGFDTVIHLAALSNDPIGNMNTKWTEDINFHASVNLARMAKKAGVSRFLFSSSCIMYGMSEANVVNEESPLDPQTEYAASKVKSETAIRGLADSSFSPTFLRNGTVYGLSPRMRFDTVLNELMGNAMTTGKVVLHSDGMPWRPVIHVKDVARSFINVVKAPRETVHNQAFNNGANHLNYQIIDLARIVVDTVPGCELHVESSSGADQRTYKADFTKYAEMFPDFKFEWTAQDGAKELFQAFNDLGLTADDFQGPRFIRLKWLTHLLETKSLAGALRWQEKG